jgi:hypothetical protein
LQSPPEWYVPNKITGRNGFKTTKALMADPIGNKLLGESHAHETVHTKAVETSRSINISGLPIMAKSGIQI